MRHVWFVLTFGVAIWSMSAGWVAVRRFWDAPTREGWLATLGYTAVFVVAFLYLGFRVYAADRAAGKVRRPIRLYERVLERREQRLAMRKGLK